MQGLGAVSELPLSTLPSASGPLIGEFKFSNTLDMVLNPTVRLTSSLQFDNQLNMTISGRDTVFGQFDFASQLNMSIAAVVQIHSALVFNNILAMRIDPRTAVGPYDNAFVDSQAQIESPKAELDAGLSTTRRPGALTFDYLTAYSLGPESIGAADTGILGWAWYVRAESGTVFFARSNDSYDGWDDEVVLFNFSGADIAELDVAFEENGRIVVVAERPTGPSGTAEVWIYWFNPTAGAFVFEKLDTGRTPRVVLDNPNDTTIADVQVAYMQDGAGLLTRRQSEDYTPSHTSVFTDSTDWYLEEFARNRGNRLVAILSKRSGDEYYLDRIESTLYPVYPSDVMTMAAKVSTASALDTVALLYSMDHEQLSVVSEILDTSDLHDVVITNNLFDKDTLSMTPTVRTASALDVVVIVYTLFDVESLQMSAAVRTTSTLVAIVISSTLKDNDTLKFVPSVLASSTLA